jgi:hypothetical protein
VREEIQRDAAMLGVGRRGAGAGDGGIESDGGRYAGVHPLQRLTRLGINIVLVGEARLVLALCVMLFLLSCSRTSSVELFNARAECANQARQFEANWRKKNGSDFQILRFVNHYNQIQGRCFVYIHYGSVDYSWEAVYDALQAVERLPLALVVHSSESKNDQQEAAKMRQYMEDDLK